MNPIHTHVLAGVAGAALMAGVAKATLPTTAPAPTPLTGMPLLPDPKLTPGDTLPVTKDQLCVPGYAGKTRNVSEAMKRAVYAEYGITTPPGQTEIDHLISLELGGSNDIKNLWPESYLTQPWNARVKDALEDVLHADVCAGTITLQDAQAQIRSNWIDAYKRRFHTDLPLPAHTHQTPVE